MDSFLCSDGVPPQILFCFWGKWRALPWQHCGTVLDITGGKSLLFVHVFHIESKVVTSHCLRTAIVTHIAVEMQNPKSTEIIGWYECIVSGKIYHSPFFHIVQVCRHTTGSVAAQSATVSERKTANALIKAELCHTVTLYSDTIE